VVDSYQHFGGPYDLNIQDEDGGISFLTKRRKQSSEETSASNPEYGRRRLFRIFVHFHNLCSSANVDELNQFKGADHSGRAVFARSNTGIVGSNPTRGVGVCVLLFCVCVVVCIGSGLATG
jgi:hypothetical protein